MSTPTHPVELLILDVKDGIDAAALEFTKFRAEMALTVGADDGAVRQAYGFVVGNPRQLYWLRQFREGSLPTLPAAFPASLDDLRAPDSQRAVHTFRFRELPDEVLSAPVIEASTITLKETVDADAFAASQATLTAEMRASPVFRGMARTVPEDRVTLTLIGWQSIEGHYAWAEANMGTSLVQLIQSLEKSSHVHVSFTIV
ncbi:uncharacterized protein B0H18DRAFT_33014 [Fomitopsis serialis]|uniref:uncharacterized protein n=1 Tax=Fomitopsis serialis TaxID=139415 RepID=UPI002008DBCC|nr:uncharacterized protein B0H18DRAFT_33014 [Neoantrodia serialis]KAH9932634.1 hypothetical protein B0H18DRAFT_33014 [Neoantrodia serialis]